MEEAIFSNIKTPEKPPNCLRCSHFRITWDKIYPRACDLFGIKCANLPAAEVFRATGANCPSFSLKKGIK